MVGRCQLRSIGTCVALGSALMGVLSTPRDAAAQRVRIVNGQLFQADDFIEADSRPSFREDRELTQRLGRAEKFLDAGQHDLALPLIQSLLDDSGDTFYQIGPEDAPQLRSLKQDAQRIVATLPPEAQRQYELSFGPQAQNMLDDALQKGDRDQLAEVARRFAHTAAGFEAGYRLGQWLLDQDEPGAAARQFEQLRMQSERAKSREPLLTLLTAVSWSRAGNTAESRDALAKLRALPANAVVRVGGERFAVADVLQNRLPDLAPVVAGSERFARDWRLLRGDAARAAVAEPAVPLSDPLWSQSTIFGDEFGMPNHRDLSHAVTELRGLAAEYRKDSSFASLFTANPLVVGEEVVVRCLSNLRAYNLRTGELAWQSSLLDPSFVQLVDQNHTEAEARGQIPAALREPYFTQRVWLDATFGTLSSDGRRIYAVEDLGFRGSLIIDVRGEPHPLAPRDYNRLAAYDAAADGRLVWQLGGPPGGLAPLAGTFFLGPPLPVGRELHCIAETGGEIALLVLDPETGQLLWRQPLVQPGRSVKSSGVRRFAGLSPSSAAGVLVCPTAAGAVVAIDLNRRTLLWGYRYDIKNLERGYNRDVMVFPGVVGNNVLIDDPSDGLIDARGRWIDSAPTLGDGYVVLTPRDSNELHCLNLEDGSLAWKRPRGNDLFVAGLFNRTLVVVGQSQIMAYDLETGQPAWESPATINRPAGRGFQVDNRYHLPLEGGELLTLDLRSGQVLARSAARRELIGNLVAVRGQVICQTLDGIVAFPPLAELENRLQQRLATQPNNAEALAFRGELRLHRGDEAGGIADLRKAMQAATSPRVARMLSEAVLEPLRSDFPTYEADAARLTALPGPVELSPEFLRVYADGLADTGRPQQAFLQYLRLAVNDEVDSSLEAADGTWSVWWDIRLRPRLQATYADTPADARKTLDTTILQTLEQYPERRQHLLSLLPPSAATEAARLKLARQPNELSCNAERAAWLTELRKSANAEIAATATAELAALLTQSDAPPQAKALVDELENRWADIKCGEELTGREFAGNWRKTHAAALPNRNRWIDRSLVAEDVAGSRRVETEFTLPWQGPRNEVFADWSFQLDERRFYLMGRDGYGQTRWKLLISEASHPVAVYTSSYVTGVGHLLVVWLGADILVVDTLGKDGQPQLLWRQNLVEGLSGSDPKQVSSRPFIGMNRFIEDRTDDEGRMIGLLGPVSSTAVCYQFGTRLEAVDPYTGDLLWQRDNLPRGCLLFGGDGLLCVLPPDSKQVQIYRMDDGAAIAERDLKNREDLIASVGRHGLTWSHEDNATRLGCTDLVTGQELWTRTFGAGAALSLIGEEEVGVYERNGRLTILSTPEGRQTLQTALPEQPMLSAFQLLRRNGNYLVLTKQFGEQEAVLATTPTGGSRIFPVKGLMAAVTNDGTRLWTTDLDNWNCDLQQPSQLPVLVLTREMLQEFGRARWNTSQPSRAAVMILDSRTGQTVYQEPQPRFIGPFRVSATDFEDEIRATFQNRAVVLKPGDPLPASSENSTTQ